MTFFLFPPLSRPMTSWRQLLSLTATTGPAPSIKTPIKAPRSAERLRLVRPPTVINYFSVANVELTLPELLVG